jgi:hypothetical protein
MIVSAALTFKQGNIKNMSGGVMIYYSNHMK